MSDAIAAGPTASRGRRRRRRSRRAGAARHLHAAGRRCIVLEASDGVGGRVRTDVVDGFTARPRLPGAAHRVPRGAPPARPGRAGPAGASTRAPWSGIGADGSTWSATRSARRATLLRRLPSPRSARSPTSCACSPWRRTRARHRTRRACCAAPTCPTIDRSAAAGFSRADDRPLLPPAVRRHPARPVARRRRRGCST